MATDVRNFGNFRREQIQVKNRYALLHGVSQRTFFHVFGRLLKSQYFRAQNAENLPVLLYIHGGAFVICSSDERPFDGKEIAKEGVICVTANYRLNVFGYNADEGAQNLAFYDMICAIEWVKQNISAFGGDPSRITLMGQSAGAISIQNLVLLPKVKEMVQGSIMLSGGGSVRGIFAPKSLKRAKRFFARVRKDLQAKGLDPTTCNAQDLYLAWYRQNKKNLALSMLSTMPVFDGESSEKTCTKTHTRTSNFRVFSA